MPAFEAMRELRAQGGLGVGVAVVNVAYGEGDVTWAQRYGVDTNLVFDQGGANVVRPLGIGTFTTLVVDPDGSILLRDRPDREGYRQRVRAALGVGDVEHDSVDPSRPPPKDEALDTASVERVVASHRDAIRKQCWNSIPAPKPSRVAVTVMLTIDAKGRVVKASSAGDHDGIARCLERHAATWIFPGSTAADGPTTQVQIPFRFQSSTPGAGER
jgi:hypothetical protein